MKVKVTTLYCVICSLANILHVYQICDEYLRYDVTTNVQVSVPDEIPFPSITLCVDLIDSLNWAAISNETRRKLLSFISEPSFSYMVTNPDKILSRIEKLPQASRDVMSRKVYGILVKELSVEEIINVSASLSEMVDNIKTTKLLYNVSQLVSLRKEEKVSKGQVSFNTNESHNLQFTVDMTYIHLREKCIVIRPQPELQNTINFDDQIRKSGTAFFSFGGQYNRMIRVLVLKHGYLNTPTDTWISFKSNRKILSSFVTHSSTLLEYPYKTNCRDYSKSGMLSRSQCRQQCFKTLFISRFKGIPEESYAFQSDTTYLQTAPKDNESLFQDILEHCKRSCFQRECQSLVYIQSEIDRTNLTSPYVYCSWSNKSKSLQSVCEEQDKLRKSCIYTLLADGKPGTRTETQPAIPLVSFLTGLFSTFGFWLGLSVFGSANFIQILRNKIRKKKKIKPRTQQNNVRIIRRQQSTSHSNSSWKQVKVSSPVHRLSSRRTCQ